VDDLPAYDEMQVDQAIDDLEPGCPFSPNA
jgi:hypothetical protein